MISPSSSCSMVSGVSGDRASFAVFPGGVLFMSPGKETALGILFLGPLITTLAEAPTAVMVGTLLGVGSVAVFGEALEQSSIGSASVDGWDFVGEFSLRERGVVLREG